MEGFEDFLNSANIGSSAQIDAEIITTTGVHYSLKRKEKKIFIQIVFAFKIFT